MVVKHHAAAPHPIPLRPRRRPHPLPRPPTAATAAGAATRSRRCSYCQPSRCPSRCYCRQQLLLLLPPLPLQLLQLLLLLLLLLILLLLMLLMLGSGPSRSATSREGCHVKLLQVPDDRVIIIIIVGVHARPHHAPAGRRVSKGDDGRI